MYLQNDYPTVSWAYLPDVHNYGDVLLHLILKYSEYDHIMDFADGRNIVEAFKDRFLSPIDGFDQIGREFWMKEFRFISNTLYRKSLFITELDHLFEKIISGCIDHVPVPPITNEAADRLGEELEGDNIPFFSEDLGRRFDVNFEINEEWKPNLPVPDDASEEITNAIRDQQAIIDYTHGHLTSEATKMMALRILLCGSPGVGKSYLLNALATLLLSKGVKEITFTCLSSNRAKDINGLYLHQLMKLGNYLPNSDINFSIAKIWTGLQHNPVYLNKLRSIRVLFIDELGQLTGNHMKIMNRIFMKLHESTEFFGGIHVIATIDHLQLLIDEVDSVYKYSPLMFYFKPFVLQYFIRATCLLQQRLLLLLRKHPKSPFEKDEILNLISDHCNFTDNFANLEIEQPCLTMTKHGRQNISTRRSQLQAEQGRVEAFMSLSEDFLMSHGGVLNEIHHSDPIVEKISRNSSLPSKSNFFVNQTVQSAMIIHRRNQMIPRSTMGVITAIQVDETQTITEISVKFGEEDAIRLV